MFADQSTRGKYGAGIQYCGSHTKSLLGESAHKLQVPGFGGLQMNPGSQPQTWRFVAVWICTTGAELVGAGQTVTDLMTVWPGKVTVTGTVLVTVFVSSLTVV